MTLTKGLSYLVLSCLTATSLSALEWGDNSLNKFILLSNGEKIPMKNIERLCRDGLMEACYHVGVELYTPLIKQHIDNGSPSEYPDGSFMGNIVEERKAMAYLELACNRGNAPSCNAIKKYFTRPIPSDSLRAKYPQLIKPMTPAIR